MVTILVVDRKTSIVIEKIDDSKEDFIEAVLLSTHSTSKPTVVSYVSIFENFWNQVELYQKLNQHDRMQNEFINIAAHELRTPAQSILGYAELAKSDTQHTEKQIQSFIEVIYRNAFRIQKLTKDILDVARIESHTLRLDKIKFNLEEVIQNAIEDTKLKPVADGHNVKLEFKRGRSSKGILVVADRDRITQVISNLLDNALKFTSEGVVSVDASQRRSIRKGRKRKKWRWLVFRILAQVSIRKYFQDYLRNFPASRLAVPAWGCIFLKAL
jgi:signal transduction histidine kinase